MACYHFIISIYDTSLVSTGGPEPINFSAKNDVQLIYEGGDEKLFNLFNSRLEFSLEVNYNDSTSSLYYESLFTGNETKYKVVVTDDSDSILWSGFMLPESYQEPFTTGTFYVKFIATDGVSRLKGKDLKDYNSFYPLSWYKARHSIIKVIADCLKLTGLNLAIRVDPAIENEGAGRRLDKIFISGGTWLKDENETDDAFTILEAVLLEIGCVLFQQDNYWYIIGLNTRSNGQTIFNNYDVNGVYINDSNNTVNKAKYIDWFSTPTITMLPPYEKISVELGLEENGDLFPENMVVQDWTKIQQPQDPPRAEFWQATGGIFNGVEFKPYLYNEKWEGINDWPTYVDEPIKLKGIVGAPYLSGIQNDQWYLGKYLHLKNTPWISGGNGETLSWEFEIVTWWPNPGSHNWQTTVNNTIIQFSILIDNVVVASNVPGFNGREKYFLENESELMTQDNFNLEKITSKFVFNDFTVPNNGNLDIRIYHPGDAEDAGIGAIMEYFIVPKFEMIYNNVDQGNLFERQRDIDFTKTKDLTLAHGDSLLDRQPNNFIIQDLIPLNDFTEINTVSYGDVGNYGWSILLEDVNEYLTLQNHANRIFYKRFGSDYYEFVNNYELFTDSPGGTTYYYIKITFLDGFKPNPTGQLLVRGSAGDPQTNLVKSYRQKWRKSTNSNGYGRYGYALAELMHDIYFKSIITMEGSSYKLFWPLDLLAYNLNNTTKKFLTTRLTLIPGENSTNITAIEFINENVEDYIQENDGFED